MNHIFYLPESSQISTRVTLTSGLSTPSLDDSFLCQSLHQTRKKTNFEIRAAGLVYIVFTSLLFFFFFYQPTLLSYSNIKSPSPIPIAIRAIKLNKFIEYLPNKMC